MLFVNGHCFRRYGSSWSVSPAGVTISATENHPQYLVMCQVSNQPVVKCFDFVVVVHERDKVYKQPAEQAEDAPQVQAVLEKIGHCPAAADDGHIAPIGIPEWLHGFVAGEQQQVTGQLFSLLNSRLRELRVP